MLNTEWDMLALCVCAVIVTVLHALGKAPLWPAVLLNTAILAIARITGKL